MVDTTTPVLQVRNLRTRIDTRTGPIDPVDGVSFEIRRGEAVGLVGESGSGKSMTCMSIVRILPGTAEVVDGEVLLGDDERSVDLLQLTERGMRRVRGSRIGMILQDPLASLNPVHTIGEQVAEGLRMADPSASRHQIRERVHAALSRVQIPDPAARADDYPFQFSGGMRQRVTAAIAMSQDPDLLIADEPTTALDVTTQKEFLDLLGRLRRETGMALLFVSHDLAVVGQLCDRIAVMYGGRIVEQGPVEQVFAAPTHPYTRALLRSLPQVHRVRLERLYQIGGEPPDLHELPRGCRFAPRCPDVEAICNESYPPMVDVGVGSCAACWLHVSDEQRPLAPRGMALRPTEPGRA